MAYTEKELLDELQRVSEEYCDGEAPTTIDIRQYGMCSEHPYYRCFGGWSSALEEAGYKSRSYDSSQMDKEEVLKEIKKVSKENCEEKTPTWRDAIEHCQYHPETYTIWFNCEWNDLIEEAGLDINKQEESTKQDIINEIQRISEEKYDGNVIPSSEISAQYNRFGSWNEICKEAGLDPEMNATQKEDVINSCREILYEERRIPRLSDIESNEIPCGSVYKFYDSKRELLIDAGLKEIIKKEVYRISDNLPPTCRQFQSETDFYLELVKDLFGSWVNLLDECGFDPKARYKGENHKNWRGGHNDYYGPSWSSQRKKAVERDTYECRICGRDDFIQVHHITPVRYWNIEEEHEEMNHLRNLITLCPRHHGLLEGEFMGRSCDEFVECVREKYGVMLY